NTKTFEAIHDTLLKIVDRLASLEDNRPEPAMPAEPMRPIALRDAPSIVPTGAMPLAGDAPAPPISAQPEVGQPASAVGRPGAATAPAEAPTTSVNPSPAEAAAAAAFYALGTDEPAAEPESRVRSMLGGLTRAFARKQPAEPAKTEPSLPGMAA